MTEEATAAAQTQTASAGTPGWLAAVLTAPASSWEHTISLN